jgi:hypothetical protein
MWIGPFSPLPHASRVCVPTPMTLKMSPPPDDAGTASGMRIVNTFIRRRSRGALSTG